MAENPDRAPVDTLYAHCSQPKEAHIAVADRDVNAGAEGYPVFICPRNVYQPIAAPTHRPILRGPD